MKKLIGITAILLLLINGLSSCSDEQGAGQDQLAGLSSAEIAQRPEFSKFRTAFIGLLGERSTAPEDSNIALINKDNQHLLIEEAKILLEATGNGSDLAADNVAIVERALEVYAERTQSNFKK